MKIVRLTRGGVWHLLAGGFVYCAIYKDAGQNFVETFETVDGSDIPSGRLCARCFADVSAPPAGDSAPFASEDEVPCGGRTDLMANFFGQVKAIVLHGPKDMSVQLLRDNLTNLIEAVEEELHAAAS